MIKKPFMKKFSHSLWQTQSKALNQVMKKMIKPEVISNTPMESLEEACAYFKQVLQEHLDKKRDITLFAIAVVGGRLKVVEGLPK